MTGKQFQIIRRFNHIYQMEIAQILGFKSAMTIKRIEGEERVPERYIKIIAERCSLDFEKLCDDEWVNDYVNNIPQRYKTRKIFNPLSIYNTNKICLNDLSKNRKK